MNNQSFLIHKSLIDGMGLFTETSLPANLILFRLIGNIITYNNLIEISSDISNRFQQIDKTLYLDCNGQLGDWYNHSCNPNCVVKIAPKNAFLMTIRPIAAGEELTVDYSLTSTETPEQWSMSCKCGIYGCRKVISGFASLPEKIKNNYVKAKMVPEFILE